MNKQVMFFIFLYTFISSAVLARPDPLPEKLGADCREVIELDTTDNFFTTNAREREMIARCQSAIEIILLYRPQLCGSPSSRYNEIKRDELVKDISKIKKPITKREFSKIICQQR